MPKMKTHSGAKKRFSVTRTGKVQSRAAAKRHRLTSKSKRMKRDGRSTLVLREQDGYNILTYAMPYQAGKLSNARKRKAAKFAAKKAAQAAAANPAAKAASNKESA
ncbi:MAG: 50S ribosomal protein L35 [Alphaproteobacteria bacterium]|nr:50S ribosomal protein L35 [Alphaproteobacteria bacterium]